MSSAASPGLSTPSQIPLVICDLDETILSVNSFPVWVKYLIFGHFSDMKLLDRWRLALQTIMTIAQRKISKTDHAVTKATLQRLWQQAVQQDSAGVALDWVLSDLMRTVRPNLTPLLQRITVGKVPAILATAAAAEYALPLGQRLGFTHILATASPAMGAVPEPHNSGTVKRDRALALAQAQGWDTLPRVFLTDHIDDLPLIAVADKVLWFGNYKSLQAVQKAAPDRLIIDALTLDGKELLAEVYATTPLPPPPPASATSADTPAPPVAG